MTTIEVTIDTLVTQLKKLADDYRVDFADLRQHREDPDRFTAVFNGLTLPLSEEALERYEIKVWKNHDTRPLPRSL